MGGLEGLGEIKSQALSDADIREILGNDTKIMTQPDLAHCEHIDDCFDSKGRCILLYLTMSSTSGHWVCMIRHKDRIEQFDPQGEKPEEPLANVPAEELKAQGESEPQLTNLLRASGIPVFQNTKSFQQNRADVATCGRHSVVRCLQSPQSLQKYEEIIKKSGMSPDTFVSALTAMNLGK